MASNVDFLSLLAYAHAERRNFISLNSSSFSTIPFLLVLLFYTKDFSI